MDVFGAGAAYLAARARVVTGVLLWAARWTPYLEPELLGLRELVGEGSVCIDVGAAAGVYTVALSHLAGESGAVHSVEPLASVHPRCSRLLRARDRGNVRHYAVALGAVAGPAVMRVPVRGNGLVTGRSFLAQRACGLGANAEFAGHVPVPVEVVTLDQLCEASGVGRVDFVKIDVEGAELQVLEGSESVVGAWRPTVLVEIEERHTARYGQRAEEVVAWFERHGYSMHTWVGAWRPAGAVCPQTRNYLFRPRPDPRTGPSPGSSAAPCPVAPCRLSAEVADGSRERAA